MTLPWEKPRVPRTSRQAPQPLPSMLPVPEWQKIILQVVGPSEDGKNPGTVIEGLFARVATEVWIKLDGTITRGPLGPNDDLRVAAAKLLRAKWRRKQSSFNDPIQYPPKAIV